MLSRLKPEVRVSEDDTEIELSIPAFGLHNVYNPGVGSMWLVSNLMTLAAYMSIRTRNFFTNDVGLHGHNLFVVQTILKIKPEYHSIIKPYFLWPQVKSLAKLESFYRSTAVINQKMISQDLDAVIAESHVKMINLDMNTRRATSFPPQLIKKFMKYHEQPHVSFMDVSEYLKMDLNSSELYYKRLLNETEENQEIYNMVEVLFESDEDWNQHVSNSVYLRLCCNCLSRAILENGTFQEAHNSPKLRISQMTNCYLRECKSHDTVAIFCILNRNCPTVLDFKMFKQESAEKHQIVYVSQMLLVEPRSKM